VPIQRVLGGVAADEAGASPKVQNKIIKPLCNAQEFFISNPPLLRHDRGASFSSTI
jgi:hypothetical protein